MSATLEVAVLALVYLLRLKHSCWKHSIQPPQVLLDLFDCRKLGELVLAAVAESSQPKAAAADAAGAADVSSCWPHSEGLHCCSAAELVTHSGVRSLLAQHVVHMWFEIRSLGLKLAVHRKTSHPRSTATVSGPARLLLSCTARCPTVLCCAVLAGAGPDRQPGLPGCRDSSPGAGTPAGSRCSPQAGMCCAGGLHGMVC